MGYGRGRGNNWSGRGPFSHLPPWQRPGWLYGKGACWQLYGAPYNAPPTKPEDEATLLAEQKELVEEQLKAMQETLAKIQTRLNEINK